MQFDRHNILFYMKKFQHTCLDAYLDRTSEAAEEQSQDDLPPHRDTEDMSPIQVRYIGHDSVWQVANHPITAF